MRAPAAHQAEAERRHPHPIGTIGSITGAASVDPQRDGIAGARCGDVRADVTEKENTVEKLVPYEGDKHFFEDELTEIENKMMQALARKMEIA